MDDQCTNEWNVNFDEYDGSDVSSQELDVDTLWGIIVKYCNSLFITQTQTFIHPKHINDTFDALNIEPPTNGNELKDFKASQYEIFIKIGLELIGGTKCATINQNEMEGTTNMIMINEDEFIIAEKRNGLYVYNKRLDTFHLLLSYPKLVTVHDHNICYDCQSNIVYLFCNEDELITMNLNTKTTEINNGTDVCGNPIGQYPSILILNESELHIIGGSDNIRHLLWNKKKKEFETIYTFLDWNNGFCGHALIHNRRRNNLLMLGGFDFMKQENNDDDKCDHVSDSIWKYNINSKQWNKLKDIKLPNKMFDFGFVLDGTERFCIIFGGYKDNFVKLESVYILDTYDMLFYESEIKIPWGRYEAIVLHNEKDALLVEGFVRKCITDLDMAPIELLELIETYYKKQYVHIINGNGYHYSVLINDILNAPKMKL
eukprot:237097_1